MAKNLARFRKYLKAESQKTAVLCWPQDRYTMDFPQGFGFSISPILPDRHSQTYQSFNVVPLSQCIEKVY